MRKGFCRKAFKHIFSIVFEWQFVCGKSWCLVTWIVDWWMCGTLFFICMKSRQNKYNKWTVEAKEEKTQSTVVRSLKCFFITLVHSTVFPFFHSCYAVPSYSFANIAFYLVFVHVGFSDYTHDTLPRLWKSTLGYVSKFPHRWKIKEIMATKEINTT